MKSGAHDLVLKDNLARLVPVIERELAEAEQRRARKKAEAALRESEERFHGVVDSILDGLITMDERGTVQTFNPAAERIFGYSAGEVVGQNVKTLMPEPYHGEHDGYLRNYLRTGEAKIIGSGREVEGRRKDGTIFPLDLAVNEVIVSGQRAFSGIVRDITERKQAEEALRESEVRYRGLFE